MGGYLLITRPEYDAPTRYLSRWSEKIIKEAERRQVKVSDLHGEKVTREGVIGRLEKIDKALVVLNGHGDDACVTGHGNAVILKAGDKKAVQSKIIFARACQSAKVLGTIAVEEGALSYLGYKEDFWLMYDETRISRPLEDGTAALFLEPSNHVAISLLKGHSSGESNERSRGLFRKNIENLLLRGPGAADYGAVPLLYWNMINQVCLGDQHAVLP